MTRRTGIRGLITSLTVAASCVGALVVAAPAASAAPVTQTTAVAAADPCQAFLDSYNTYILLAQTAPDYQTRVQAMALAIQFYAQYINCTGGA
ncbi:hypothetical protein ACFYXF_22550 [Streptomyces sp. NPDC002680]|uniref:hypothetical protein n=1 Tax=Streptomyces sp. NPDC002680 TaxID=3364659 RepID=UPI00369010B1